MSNILFIGKELPDGQEFAEALAGTTNTVFTTVKNPEDASSFEIQHIYSCGWNKASAISSYSVMINAETKLESINHVVFYFDSEYFNTIYGNSIHNDIAEITNNLISSYLYFENELLKRADKKRENLVVSFLLKEYPSKYEVIQSKQQGVASNGYVSIAQNAFCAMAEQFVTNMESRDYLTVILGKCSPANELYKSERQLAQWVNSNYETLENQKNKQTLKHSLNWLKAGAKIQNGFSFFK